jgi:hypothetical protein
MRRIVFLLACLCSLALVSCAAKKAAVTEAEGNKCKVIAASEEWFKELMKTAAENISPASEEPNCPCYETITCEGVKYCSAHKCVDGSIHNPWEVNQQGIEP